MPQIIKESPFAKVNGSIKFKDTYFDDLRMDAISLRTGVVSPTDETGFRGNNAFLARNFVDNQADEIQFEVQLPHSWREAGQLFPHFHFSPWITSTGDKAVRFILEYYWANYEDQFPAVAESYQMTTTWNGNKQWII